ncbi:uncharacterized protein LOC123534527 [Mercenaria mercenaria]|uniref:uncharacterized protein LOC123534527 n=1 Tax=Mercenaria mercenaria TaxID=6596 RepID=UPI00234EDD9A|nr:uncharacterized protein LOC123534527 [Mercenaria mercenaria]
MTTKRNDLVKVHLRVYKPLDSYQGRSNEYFVAVVGPGLQLGNDDPNIAPRCKPVGHNYWVKDLWLQKESTIHYKFLVVKACTGAAVDIETILPHKIYIGQKPVMVEHTFNKQAFVGKEVHEGYNHSTTVVGRKDTFHVPSLNIPKSDKVSFVVPKIRNPPKYTPPRNIGMILHKNMVPVTDNSKDLNTSLPPAAHQKECHNNLPSMKEEQTQNKVDQFKHTSTNTVNAKAPDTQLTKTKNTHSQSIIDVIVSSAKSDSEGEQGDGAKFVNGVSEDKGGHSRYFKVGKKSLVVVAAGVALASCLGYFAFYKR